MPSLSVLLGGIAVAASLTAWGLWERSDAIKYKAAALSAIEANGTLIRERDRYRTSAAAEAERAGQRLRERDGLAAQVATLRQSLGDSLGACQWTDEQARAVDEFLSGRRKP